MTEIYFYFYFLKIFQGLDRKHYFLIRFRNKAPGEVCICIVQNSLKDSAGVTFLLRWETSKTAKLQGGEPTIWQLPLFYNLRLAKTFFFVSMPGCTALRCDQRVPKCVSPDRNSKKTPQIKKPARNSLCIAICQWAEKP